MKRSLILLAALLTVCCLFAALLSGCGKTAPEAPEQPAQSEEAEPELPEDTENEPEPAPAVEPSGQTVPEDEVSDGAEAEQTGTPLQNYVDQLNDRLSKMSADGEAPYTFIWREADCRADLVRMSDASTLGDLSFGGVNGIPVKVNAPDVEINITSLTVLPEYRQIAETILPEMLQMNYPLLSQEDVTQISKELIEKGIYSANHISGYISESDTSVFYLLSCDTENTAFAGGKSGSDQASVPAQESGESAGKTCRLDSLPGEITVPEEFYAYSKGGDYTPEMCQAQGFTYDKMELYLSLSSVDVMILPAKDTIQNAEVIINVRVKDGDYSPEMDFAKLDDASLKAVAGALVQGFGTQDYEIVKRDNLTFIKFSAHMVKDEIRYATVINGRMVYFYAEFDGELREEYAQALEQIAVSLRY